MNLDSKVVNKSIIILTIFIFILIMMRIGTVIRQNYHLLSNFTPNPNEPYQRRMPIAEEDFIDDYIYRLYSPFAVAPIGRPNTFVLKQSINYYSVPDDNLEPVITLSAGKTYMISTNDINDYKYGIQSWPTYKKGWRFVIPFIEEVDGELITSAYYVKLTDLISPLKSIQKKVHYQIPKGYDNRRILLIKDEMLYKEGYYLSPDMQKPIADGLNITLLISGLCLIIIKIILRIKIDRK